MIEADWTSLKDKKPTSHNEAKAIIDTIAKINVQTDNRRLRSAIGEISEMYGDESDFFRELLQNMDDNKYSVDIPSLEIEITPAYLRVNSNEDGFTEKNAYAFCDICVPLKKFNDAYKGRKGIGSKSYFNISPEFEVNSNYFHFRLNSKTWIIPEWIDDKKLTEGTVFNFPLTFAKMRALSLKSDFITLETMLFLDRLTRVKINVNEPTDINSSERVYGIQKTKLTGDISKRSLIAKSGKKVEKSEWLVFEDLIDLTELFRSDCSTEDFEKKLNEYRDKNKILQTLDKDAASRIDKMGEGETLRIMLDNKRYIVERKNDEVGLYAEESYAPKRPREVTDLKKARVNIAFPKGKYEGPNFCVGFPVKHETYGFQFLVNTNFVLTPDRNSINLFNEVNKAWNDYLINKIPKIFSKALYTIIDNDIIKKEELDILRYLPLRVPGYNPDRWGLINKLRDEILNEVATLKIIPCWKNKKISYEKGSDIILCKSKFSKLINEETIARLYPNKSLATEEVNTDYYEALIKEPFNITEFTYSDLILAVKNGLLDRTLADPGLLVDLYDVLYDGIKKDDISLKEVSALRLFPIDKNSDEYELHYRDDVEYFPSEKTIAGLKIFSNVVYEKLQKIPKDSGKFQRVYEFLTKLGLKDSDPYMICKEVILPSLTDSDQDAARHFEYVRYLIKNWSNNSRLREACEKHKNKIYVLDTARNEKLTGEAVYFSIEYKQENQDVLELLGGCSDISVLATEYMIDLNREQMANAIAFFSIIGCERNLRLNTNDDQISDEVEWLIVNRPKELFIYLSKKWKSLHANNEFIKFLQNEKWIPTTQNDFAAPSEIYLPSVQVKRIFGTSVNYLDNDLCAHANKDFFNDIGLRTDADAENVFNFLLNSCPDSVETLRILGELTQLDSRSIDIQTYNAHHLNGKGDKKIKLSDLFITVPKGLEECFYSVDKYFPGFNSLFTSMNCRAAPSKADFLEKLKRFSGHAVSINAFGKSLLQHLCEYYKEHEDGTDYSEEINILQNLDIVLCYGSGKRKLCKPIESIYVPDELVLDTDKQNVDFCNIIAGSYTNDILEFLGIPTLDRDISVRYKIIEPSAECKTELFNESKFSVLKTKIVASMKQRKNKGNKKITDDRIRYIESLADAIFTYEKVAVLFDLSDGEHSLPFAGKACIDIYNRLIHQKDIEKEFAGSLSKVLHENTSIEKGLLHALLLIQDVKEYDSILELEAPEQKTKSTDIDEPKLETTPEKGEAPLDNDTPAPQTIEKKTDIPTDLPDSSTKEKEDEPTAPQTPDAPPYRQYPNEEDMKKRANDLANASSKPSPISPKRPTKETAHGAQIKKQPYEDEDDDGSIAENKRRKDTGFLGEYCVYNQLIKDPKLQEVKWVSKNAEIDDGTVAGDDSLGYDISFVSKDSHETTYVEVKSSLNRGKTFILTSNEREFGESHPRNYCIYIVWDIATGKPDINYIKNPFDFENSETFERNSKFEVNATEYRVKFIL